MILGILNQGKMTSFVNILELQKPFLDLSLKNASKWPRFDKSQKTIMKLIPWTKNNAKIHPSLKNREKKCTSMTYLRNEDFASQASKSKFLIIKKISYTFFQLAYASKKPLEISLKNIDSSRNQSNFSQWCQKKEISQK